MGGGIVRTRNENIISFGPLRACVVWILVVSAGPLAAQARQGGEASAATGSGAGVLALPTWSGSVRIDGRLDEAGWGDAPVVELPWEIQPSDNGSAPVATRCRLAHDDTHLYLGCEALDPNPGQIRAYITDRDDLDGQDRITLTIDPFGAARQAYEFSVSPLGVQGDALFDGQGLGGDDGGGRGRRDRSWDAHWSSAGRLTDGGYLVEVAIPLKSLRFPSGSGTQTWRFSITRDWPRDTALQTRNVPWDRSDACELCQAAYLVGFASIEPGANVELTPSLTGGRSDERVEQAGGLRTGDVTRSVGLNALWAISPNVVLSGTANPDFSQVEADAPQLTANARFALYFPERRPFFLEGADLFTTPLQAVFTRSIADPTAGLKLTGKAGAHSFGVLAAHDRITGLLLPGSLGSQQATLEQPSTTGVLRYRRDVGASGSIGALLTGRHGEDYANEVVGVDGYLSPLGALRVNGQLLWSRTEYPERVRKQNGQPEGAFQGRAAALTLDYGTREWRALFNLRRRGSGFRADAGFEPQGNLQQMWGFVSRQWWGEDSWFTSLRADVGGWRWDQLDPAAMQENGGWLYLEVAGPRQSRLWANPNLKREVFAGASYSFPELWFGGSTEPFAGVRLSGYGVLGGQVDVENEREGRVLEVSPGLQVRLGRRTDLRFNHSVRRLETLAGERIFHAEVSQLRTVFNFDARTFIRVVLQQRRTERSPALYVAPVEPVDRSLASQVLLSYKAGPQSVLFLGYSEGRFAEVGEDIAGTPLTLRNRSFFVKASYAWRP